MNTRTRSGKNNVSVTWEISHHFSRVFLLLKPRLALSILRRTARYVMLARNQKIACSCMALSPYRTLFMSAMKSISMYESPLVQRSKAADEEMMRRARWARDEYKRQSIRAMEKGHFKQQTPVSRRYSAIRIEPSEKSQDCAKQRHRPCLQPADPPLYRRRQSRKHSVTAAQPLMDRWRLLHNVYHSFIMYIHIYMSGYISGYFNSFGMNWSWGASKYSNTACHCGVEHLNH